MSRNNKILIAIFVLLIALLLVIRYVRDPRERRIQFFNLNVDNIASIEMKTARDTLVIANDGFEWNIEYPFIFDIEQTRLNNFFSQVLPVQTSSTPVALSENSFQDYQVTEERGTMLSFFDRNNRLLDSAIIGRSGAMAYARRPDDNRVYQLSENITFVVNPSLNPWRTKSIVSIPRGQLSAIDVTYELNKYTITATDTLWLFTDSEHSFSVTENNNAFRRVLGAIERFSAFGYKDFQYEEYSSILQNPQLILNLKLIDGQEINLLFALDDDHNFIVQKNDITDHLYITDADTVDLFTKAPQHFQ